MSHYQYYEEIHPSHQLTLSNLRALEESLRTTPSKGIIPSIRSVTSASSPAFEKEVLLTPSHLSNHRLSTTDPLPKHHSPTPFTRILTTPSVPYSFPSTEHWKHMTAKSWKAILAQIRWNLNILIGQEETEALRGEIPCGEYWKVEARHSDAHNACLAAAQEEKESGGQGYPSCDLGSTPSSQVLQRQLATSSKISGQGRRRPWYRRLFPFLAATRICKAANDPQTHDTEEEEEEEPVRFSIRSRKYWQAEAVFYASHEAKVMLSRGYKEFAQKNLPPDATV